MQSSRIYRLHKIEPLNLFTNLNLFQPNKKKETYVNTEKKYGILLILFLN